MQVKAQREGKDKLNMKQRQWLTISKLAYTAKLPPSVQPPKSFIRRIAFRIFSSTAVDNVVSVVILLNICILAASWHPPNPGWFAIQETLNLAFNAFYIVEVAGKARASCSCCFFPRLHVSLHSLALCILGRVPRLLHLLLLDMPALAFA